MEISQTLLGFMFVCAVITGAFLGVIYDVIRITRIIVGIRYTRKDTTHSVGECDVMPHDALTVRILRAVLVFIEDVIFCLVCGVCVVLLLYYTNDGQFRGIAVLGVAAGFFVYYVTVGRVVIRFSEFIVELLQRALRLILKVIVLPIKLIYCLYCSTLGKILARLWERYRANREERYTRRIMSAYIESASSGFELVVLRYNVLDKKSEVKEAEA